MKVSYFEDTDTLYIEFSETGVAETRDLDENILLDIDDKGRVVSLTMEHASSNADIRSLQISGISN